MRKFTKSLLTLVLLVLAVGGAKAYEPVYPANKYDISLDASDWNKGWNATAANDGDNLAITLTGNYGAKGIALTETAATPLSSCNKICVVIESYGGGWGQLIAKSGGEDKAVTGIGTVEEGKPQTFTLEYDPADNIDEFDIQGGTGNPTIKISRVYLVEKTGRMVGTKIYTYDYKDVESFPWYHGDWGTEPTVSDGVLTATNDEVKGDPSNYMFYVADNITTDENKEYYVRATVKGSDAGSIVCNLGTWGKSSEKNLSLTTEYQDVDILLSGLPTATNNHVIFKIGKYVGTIYLKKIEIYEALATKSITVGEAGVATFSYNYAFATDDKVKAYAAKYNSVTGKVELTEVTNVPANEGVIIEATEGSYDVPVIASASAIDNDLQVSAGTVEGDGKTIYVLNKKGDNVGFYKLADGSTLAAGKAYLEINDLSARGFIGIDGMSLTGVNEVKVNKAAAKTGKIYNLNGQIVSKPTKGLYIVDGKVVSF